MHLSRPATCLSDLALDAWSSDELSPAARERVERHVAACAICRARHAQLERERAAFLAAAPSFDQHARLHVADRGRAGWRARLLTSRALAAVALAAVALLALWPAPPATRLKGGESIRCFVKRGERVEVAGPATVLRPGDRLRFAYSADQDRYFALFGRDASRATRYYPGAASAVRVRAGQQVALDFSVELDDAPGPETVHAVFCPEPFDLAPLTQALTRSGRIPAADGCKLDVLRFTKDVAR